MTTWSVTAWVLDHWLLALVVWCLASTVGVLLLGWSRNRSRVVTSIREQAYETAEAVCARHQDAGGDCECAVLVLLVNALADAGLLRAPGEERADVVARYREEGRL